VVKDPLTDESPLGELLKEQTSGILAIHPKIQPLTLWKMSRQLNPLIPNNIKLFYCVQTYVKYLQTVNAITTLVVEGVNVEVAEDHVHDASTGHIAQEFCNVPKTWTE
jgi:hypothetical protein